MLSLHEHPNQSLNFQVVFGQSLYLFPVISSLALLVMGNLRVIFQEEMMVVMKVEEEVELVNDQVFVLLAILVVVLAVVMELVRVLVIIVAFFFG